MSADVFSLNASQLANAVANKDISAVEALQASLNRLDERNPPLNAVVHVNRKLALKDAQQRDKDVAEGKTLPPLHGVPITIKDAYEVAGLVSTGGSPILKNHIPKLDSVIAQRLKTAGAVVFGKTNVPLMSGDFQTYNDVYGVSNNPWDASRTPGGSSGGAAAAVASAISFADYGSDIGGSIRTPAHFCGVYGLKTSYAIVPMRGHIPAAPRFQGRGDLSVGGPIARDPQDIKTLLLATAGADDLDAVAWNLKLPQAKNKPLRIALWLEGYPVDPETRALIQAAAHEMENHGAVVSTVSCPASPLMSADDVYELYALMLHSSVAAGLPDKVVSRLDDAAAQNPLNPLDHNSLQAHGASLRYRRWVILNHQRTDLRRRLASFFNDYDLIFCPVAPTPAIPHNIDLPFMKRRILINEQEHSYLDVTKWIALPTLAYLPALSAPVGLTPKGLPVNVQIIAPYLHDLRAVHAAQLLQQHVGFTPPPYPTPNAQPLKQLKTQGQPLHEPAHLQYRRSRRGTRNPPILKSRRFA